MCVDIYQATLPEQLIVFSFWQDFVNKNA